MISLLWKLQYAYHTQATGGLPWDVAWECAEDGYRDYGWMFCPKQAAIEGLKDWAT